MHIARAATVEESMAPILQLEGITKVFPGVIANDHIDLSLHQGEILALLGENGAGKSTLMNILYGLYAPTSGRISINGQEVVISGPQDAIRQGVGMVHQHFMLVPPLTVTENVMLGDELVHRGIFLDRRRAAARVREISEAYGLAVNPEAIIRTLPVGVQQRVEIIKVLYRSADILILDEPTAVLTPQEVLDLFVIIRRLVAGGKSVIFISHKLNEVMELADRVVVLRRGRKVGETTPAETTEEALATMMVGRSVSLSVDKSPARPQESVLEVSGLDVLDDRHQLAVKNVSFEVHQGEIVGLAGVQGNGQTELVEALTGMRPSISGTVRIDGHDVTNASPRQIIEHDVAYVPEDRQQDGLVLDFAVSDNLILNTYYRPPFARGIGLQRDVIDASARQLVQDFDVRTPGIDTAVGNLSGGNQQKVIVAREFNRPIQLLIASQPTRGLDVGSIEYIHSRIIAQRDGGAGVLLISSELDEVMQLADRILVMFRGELMADLPADEAGRDQLGLLMAGVSNAQAQPQPEEGSGS